SGAESCRHRQAPCLFRQGKPSRKPGNPCVEGSTAGGPKVALRLFQKTSSRERRATMATIYRQDVPEEPGFSRYSAGRTLVIAGVLVFALMGTSEAQRDRFCSDTARTLFDACNAGVTDDSLVKKAICINISDAEQRDDCFDELEAARAEGTQLCAEQRDGRL